MQHTSLARITGTIGVTGFRVFLGVAWAILLAIALERSTAMGVAVCLLPPTVYMFARRPDWVFVIFLFSLLVFEEFPSGEGETLERSQRTTFYSLSLGIPGLYSTDLFLMALIGMYVVRMMVTKHRLPFEYDRIFIALLVLAVISVITAVNSLVFQGALNFEKHYDVAISGLSDFNQKAAALIGFFQYKVFSYLFISYVIGCYFFSSERKIGLFLKVFFVAALTNVLVGFVRLGLDPSIITERAPLFYHSPTTWIFAMTIFFLVGQWMNGQFKGVQAAVLWGLVAILALFILISFRRTMWGGIAVSIIPFLIMAKYWERKKIYLVMATAAGFLFSVILMTPIGEAVIGRVMETGTTDASSTYRLLLFLYFLRHTTDLPMLGYGIEPLWNYQDASVGFFRISFEAIHSLYFWLLLRFGLLGFVISMGAFGAMGYTLMQLRNQVRFIRYRWLLNTMVLGGIIFLFSGIFNPVYGEVRYMILLGFGLALLSKLPSIVTPPHPVEANKSSFSKQNAGKK